MCRKFGNVRRFWRGRKEMEFTYLVKLSNPCRTPKSIVDRELIFVYFIRIQQGTRKVLWIRHHVLLKTKAKDVSTANQRTEFKVPSEILLLRCGGADGYGILGEVVKLVWIADNPFNTVPQQVSIEMFMLLHRNSTKKKKSGGQSYFCNSAGWQRINFFSFILSSQLCLELLCCSSRPLDRQKRKRF